MPFSPIMKNVYIDPFEQKKESVPSKYFWEVFLYRKVAKNEKPLYKIICLDKDKLLEKEAEIKERFGVVSVGNPTCRNDFEEIIKIYEEPVVTDLTTGELVE